MFKKFLTLFLACAMVLLSVLPVGAKAKADVTFTLSDISGKPGELVNVEIRVTSSTPIDTIALYDLEYDAEQLTFVGFDNYSAIEDKCIFGTFDAEKQYIGLAFTESEALDEYIGNLQFRINENAKGKSYKVSLESIAKNDTEDHTTTVEAGKVTVAGLLSSLLPAPAHTHSMQKVDAVTPTCLKTGSIAYWTCTSCGKNYLDANGTTAAEQVTLPADADNHPGETLRRDRKDATATADGYTGDVCCTACGRVVEAGRVIPATGVSAPEEKPKDEDKPAEDKKEDSKPTDDKKEENKPSEDQKEDDRDSGKEERPQREDKDDDEDAWENPFYDVKEGDTYYEAIRFVYENELFNGVSTHIFAPDTTMTRAMFVTVLGRLAGVDQDLYNSKEPFFQDVKADQWYTPYVAWAAEERIILGYGNGKFGCEDTITVEQGTAIIARYARYTGISTDNKAKLTQLDASSVSDWAIDDMQWAVENRVYQGSKNRLSPTSAACRGLIADMLYRYVETYE